MKRKMSSENDEGTPILRILLHKAFEKEGTERNWTSNVLDYSVATDSFNAIVNQIELDFSRA